MSARVARRRQSPRLLPEAPAVPEGRDDSMGNMLEEILAVIEGQVIEAAADLVSARAPGAAGIDLDLRKLGFLRRLRVALLDCARGEPLPPITSLLDV